MAEHGDKKITLTLVVNGTPVNVQANTNAPLSSVFEKALHEAGVAGEQDPDKWDFKDEAGNVFDRHKKLSDLGLHDGSTVYLSLRAGATG